MPVECLYSLPYSLVHVSGGVICRQNILTLPSIPVPRFARLAASFILILKIEIFFEQIKSTSINSRPAVIKPLKLLRFNQKLYSGKVVKTCQSS